MVLPYAPNPTIGKKPWGSEANNRFNYIESLAQSALDEIELSIPGTELGYAERLTSATGTATGVGATEITGLGLNVIGKGRPVNIEFYCSSVTHSVSNTNVSVGIVVDNNVTNTKNQYGAASAPSVTAGQGPALFVRRRVILDDGVAYNISVRPFAYLVAGTWTFYSSTIQPMYLAVIAG